MKIRISGNLTVPSNIAEAFFGKDTYTKYRIQNIRGLHVGRSYPLHKSMKSTLRAKSEALTTNIH